MIVKNHHEPHVLGRSRAVGLLPSIRKRGKRGKVIGIDNKTP